MSRSVAVTSLYHVQSKVVLYLYIHLLTHCREAIGRSADATSEGVYAKSQLALAFADPRDRQEILYWLLCLFCRAIRQHRPQTFLAGGQAGGTPGTPAVGTASGETTTAAARCPSSLSV